MFANLVKVVCATTIFASCILVKSSVPFFHPQPLAGLTLRVAATQLTICHDCEVTIKTFFPPTETTGRYRDYVDKARPITRNPRKLQHVLLLCVSYVALSVIVATFLRFSPNTVRR